MWQRARIHFQRIPSTNTWAKEQLADFDQTALTLVTADQQTAGRGRFTRTWVSPVGNFYGTFVFFLQAPFPAVGNIPQVLALSTVRLLDEMGFSARIKWPNDIQLNGKKLGGLLCETSLEGASMAVILGMGVNLNMELEVLSKIDQPATSLYVQDGKVREVAEFAERLYDSFAADLDLFLHRGFSPFLDAYRTIAAPLDPRALLTIRDGETLVKGRFHSFKDDGSLNAILEDGTLLNFAAGEILPL